MAGSLPLPRSLSSSSSSFFIPFIVISSSSSLLLFLLPFFFCGPPLFSHLLFHLPFSFCSPPLLSLLLSSLPLSSSLHSSYRRSLFSSHDTDSRVWPHPKEPRRVRATTHSVVTRTERTSDDHGDLRYLRGGRREEDEEMKRKGRSVQENREAKRREKEAVRERKGGDQIRK